MSNEHLPSSKNVLDLNEGLSVWRLHALPVSTLVLSGCFDFLPYSKRKLHCLVVGCIFVVAIFYDVISLPAKVSSAVTMCISSSVSCHCLWLKL